MKMLDLMGQVDGDGGNFRPRHGDDFSIENSRGEEVGCCLILSGSSFALHYLGKVGKQ
jgi:hypothetical protein